MQNALIQERFKTVKI